MPTSSQAGYKMAGEENGGFPGSGRGAPKAGRSQNRVDDWESLMRATDEVAARLLDHDEEGLGHYLRAEEIEFDRIATAEVQALILHQRRARAQEQLKNRKLVKAPLHPPSLADVGGQQKDSALSVKAVPKKDRNAAMQHLANVSRKELLELQNRLHLRTEKSVDEIRVKQSAVAAMELERLFRDQKVERELLSRDINQHYARLYSDGTLDIGFTEQVLLMFSTRHMDAQKTEQLRADLNTERDVRLKRALHEMDARQNEDILLIKSEAKKRSRLAETMKRGECEAQNTSELGRARSRITNMRAAKEKTLLANEQEALILEISVAAAVEEVEHRKTQVMESYSKAHKKHANSKDSAPNSSSMQTSRALTNPPLLNNNISKWGGVASGVQEGADPQEAAELAALQKDLDCRRTDLRKKREAAWHRNSKPALQRNMDAVLQAASDRAETARFKALSQRKESAVLAVLFPERFCAAEENDIGLLHNGATEKNNGAKTPHTVRKGEQRERAEKESKISGHVKSAGVAGDIYICTCMYEYTYIYIYMYIFTCTYI